MKASIRSLPRAVLHLPTHRNDVELTFCAKPLKLANAFSVIRRAIRFHICSDLIHYPLELFIYLTSDRVESCIAAHD